MKLIAFHQLRTHRRAPQLWLESKRLETLGLTPGTTLHLSHQQNSVILSKARTQNAIASHSVSYRRAAGSCRPILDINNRFSLSPLTDFEEIKIHADADRIVISPSVRAFHIRKARMATPPFRTLELFAGGGTLSQAVAANPLFQIQAGVEINPSFADCWEASNPQSTLYQTDIRLIHPSELDPFDIGVIGIPCTSHSLEGRAKKKLGGQPELGDTGDLFMEPLKIIAHHMPLACIFENVPSFGTSLAGMTLKKNLQHMGYFVYDTILDPHREWNQPTNRRRWLCIATLKPGFSLETPKRSFSGNIAAFLDAADPVQDRADAERIANTIAGLRIHNARHQLQGNGFEFATITPDSTVIPTITASMHKINVGPFVETEFGLRLLRKREVERIHGCTITTDHYATAIQILGQGVIVPVFSEIVRQLGNFLANRDADILPDYGQLDLF